MSTPAGRPRRRRHRSNATRLPVMEDALMSQVSQMTDLDRGVAGQIMAAVQGVNRRLDTFEDKFATRRELDQLSSLVHDSVDRVDVTLRDLAHKMDRVTVASAAAHWPVSASAPTANEQRARDAAEQVREDFLRYQAEQDRQRAQAAEQRYQRSADRTFTLDVNRVGWLIAVALGLLELFFRLPR